ncbi:MAG: hypothetical protein K6E86_01490 [Bacteroidales bacterium]|nr:hypothetical protein [Bacteroidales bacterium]
MSFFSSSSDDMMRDYDYRRHTGDIPEYYGKGGKSKGGCMSTVILIALFILFSMTLLVMCE